MDESHDDDYVNPSDLNISEENVRTFIRLGLLMECLDPNGVVRYKFTPLGEETVRHINNHGNN